MVQWREKKEWFVNEVAGLYEAMGYEVKRGRELAGVAIDLSLWTPPTRDLAPVIVECMVEDPGSGERARIVANHQHAKREMPRIRSILVSLRDLAEESRHELDEAGIDFTTYFNLIVGEVPLHECAASLLAEHDRWRAENWQGMDRFVEPEALLSGESQNRPATEVAHQWLVSKDGRLLLLLGDTGIGKSTLLRRLSAQWALAFQADPFGHPAPILIPLLDVRREQSWESLIARHFEQKGLAPCRPAVIRYLVETGRIALLYDAFDEMADQLSPEAMRHLFRELIRPVMSGGKAILTCRTQYFRDREEQREFIEGSAAASGDGVRLDLQLQGFQGAASLALQAFSADQIRARLAQARPATAREDWARIDEVYHLADLAQRPLLLEKIIQQLEHLSADTPINVASLYEDYVTMWMDREAVKQRQSDRESILRLLVELAWHIWDSGNRTVPGKSLLSILERLNAARRFSLPPESLRIIARDLVSATFFNRDDAGGLMFNHNSIEQYFLARGLHGALIQAGRDGMASLLRVLDTRPFDRKVALFRVALEPEPLDWPLQRILRDPYRPRISENALHILYWSTRIRHGMEERITDLYLLREELRKVIPPQARLEGVALEGLDGELLGVPPSGQWH
ncbi:MAG: NACHT domain-containing protein [Blastocatellia bacterium]